MMMMQKKAGAALSEEEALRLVLRAALGGPEDAGRASHQIVISRCPDCDRVTQRGRGEELEVSHTTLEQAECDAQRIDLREAEHGVVPHAAQDVPPAVRRLVMLRDRGRCVVPGCTHAVYLNLHQLNLRSEGGTHDPDLLVTLCDVHHTHVHEGRLLISGAVSSGLSFQHPDGTCYGGALVPEVASVMSDAFAVLLELGYRQGETKRALDFVRAHEPPDGAGPAHTTGAHVTPECGSKLGACRSRTMYDRAMAGTWGRLAFLFALSAGAASACSAGTSGLHDAGTADARVTVRDAEPPDVHDAEPPDAHDAEPPDAHDAEPPGVHDAEPPDIGDAEPPDSGCATPAITYHLSGVVTDLDDNGGQLGGAIQLGDPINGTYTFNPMATDSNADLTVGDYRHDTSCYGFDLKVDGIALRTDPNRVDFLVEFVNRPNEDDITMHSYNNLDAVLPNGQSYVVGILSWTLQDMTATALSTEAMVTSPPNLSDWTQFFGLDWEFIDHSIYENRVAFVRCRIDQVGP